MFPGIYFGGRGTLCAIFAKMGFNQKGKERVFFDSFLSFPGLPELSGTEHHGERYSARQPVACSMEEVGTSLQRRLLQPRPD